TSHLGPPPTEPALLPQPPPKKDSKPSEFGPTVLSPNSRKTRRVMPEKGDDHGIGNERSGPVPMSLDFSVFDHKPPVRPTINSADRKLPEHSWLSCIEWDLLEELTS
ncbi:hypothetical protein Tco_0558258, partial [Tanacetum coccineum]